MAGLGNWLKTMIENPMFKDLVIWSELPDKSNQFDTKMDMANEKDDEKKDIVYDVKWRSGYDDW